MQEQQQQQPTATANPLQQIYDGLSQKNPQLKERGFDAFKTDMADENNLKQIYEGLANKNPQLKEHGFDGFKMDMGLTPEPTGDSGFEGFGKELGLRAERGAVGLNKMLANTPNAIMRVLNAPFNMFYEAVGLPKVDPQSFNKMTGIDEYNKRYDAQSEGITGKIKQVNPKAEQGIIESAKLGDWTTFSRNLAGGVADSFAPSLAMMVSGGAMTAPQMIGSGALVFGSGKLDEIDQQAPDLPENIKLLTAAANGALEGVFETYLGSGAVGGAIKDLVTREGKEAGKRAILDGLGQAYKKIISDYPALAPLGEGFEEWGTQVSQNYIDKISGYRPDINVFEGAADALLIGVASGASHSLPLYGASKVFGGNNETEGQPGQEGQPDIQPSPEQAKQAMIQQQLNLLQGLVHKESGEVISVMDQEGKPMFVRSGDMNSKDGLLEVVYEDGTPAGNKGVIHVDKVADWSKSTIDDLMAPRIEAINAQFEPKQPAVGSPIEFNGAEYMIVGEDESNFSLLNTQSGEGIEVPKAELIQQPVLQGENEGSPLEQNGTEGVQQPVQQPIVTEKIGNQSFDFIENEDGSLNFVPNDKLTTEKALTQLEKAFADNPGWEVVAEKEQVTVPAASRFEQPTQQTVVKNIQVRPKANQNDTAVPSGDGTASEVDPNLQQEVAAETAPAYSFNGQEIDRETAQGLIEIAALQGKPEKLNGLTLNNDEELTKLVQDSFPEKKPSYKLGKKNITPAQAKAAILASENMEELSQVKVENDLLLDELISAKAADFQKQADQQQAELNNKSDKLVDLVQSYNNGTATEKRMTNTSQIAQLAAELGYNLRMDSGNLLLTNGGGKKVIKTADRLSQEQVQGHRAITDYEPEIQQTIGKFLSPVNSDGVVLGVLQPKEVNQAILDIQAGKKTVNANALLDALEEIATTGVVKIKADRKTGFPGAELSLDEYLAVIDEQMTDAEKAIAAMIPANVAESINEQDQLTPELLDEYETLIPTNDGTEQPTNGTTDPSVLENQTEEATEDSDQAAAEEVAPSVMSEEDNDSDPQTTRDEEPKEQAGDTQSPAKQGENTQAEGKRLNGQEEVSEATQREVDDRLPVEKELETASVRSKIKREEKAVNAEPTEAQKEAGNYKKGHIKVQGMDITIEQPKGSVRSGKDESGKEWSQTMNNTYGYFRRTEGKDGDQVDVFLGEDLASGKVYVVDQVNNDGSFDEHKVMLGFNSEQEAREAYLSNYEAGWQGLGTITDVSLPEFKNWLGDGQRKAFPYGLQAPIQSNEASGETTTEQAIQDAGFTIGRIGQLYAVKEGENKTLSTGKTLDEAWEKALSIVNKRQPAESKAIEKPGAKNKIFTEEAAEEARKLLRAKLGNMNSGIDPEVLIASVQLAGFHIESGVRTFADFSKTMISELGDRIKPYLKGAYENIRRYPGMEAIAKDMDTTDFVDKYDFDANIEPTETKEYGQSYFGAVVHELASDSKLAENVLASDEQNGKIAIRNAINETMPVTTRHFVNSGNAQIARSGLKFKDELIDQATNEVYQKIHGANKNEELSSSRSDEMPENSDISNKEAKTEPKKQINDEQPSLFDQDWTNKPLKESKDESNRNTVGENSTLEDGGEPARPATRNGEGRTAGTSENDRAESNERNGVEGNNTSQGRQEGGSRGTDADTSGTKLRTGESESDGNQRRTDESDSSKPDRSEQVSNSRNHTIEQGTEVAPRGEVTKIRANIAAIKLAKRLTNAGRAATKEEMKVLEKYTGWGGLSSVFKADHKHHQALKDALSQDEYDSARASTTTSFYTPTSIVSSIWDMIGRLGFKGGKILEPSAGIGHFFGLMPEGVSKKSSLTGVELDSVSGMILKLLYPDANINIEGYEEQRIPNNSQDLIVSNVPFGDFKVHDKMDKDLSNRFNIHDFFIAKSVRKLKPGGIAVFITTTSTMDKSNDLRNWVTNEGNADFIDAVRLNTDTFKSNAGTEASSDIIIIRKRDANGKSEHAKNMLDVGIEREATYQVERRNSWGGVSGYDDKKAVMSMNKFFMDNPGKVAGEMKFGFEGGNQLRPTEQRVAPKNGVNQEEVIAEFVKGLPKDIHQVEKDSKPERKMSSSDGTKIGGLTVIDGEPRISVYGGAIAPEWNDNKVAGRTKAEAVKDYLSIKDATDALLNAENEDAANIEDLRKALNKAYDTFVKRYGTLSNNRKIQFLKDDVDYPATAALENVKDISDPKSKQKKFKIEKSDIFSKRMIAPQQELKAESVADGIQVSIYKNGRVDLPFVAKLLNKTEDQVRKEILSEGLGFVNPETGLIESRDEYLSGNVRQKLQVAEQSNTDKEYDANVESLSKIIPTDIPIHLIKVSLGSTWIPTKVYDQFFKETFGVTATLTKTKADKFVGNFRGKDSVQDMQAGMAGASGSTLALNAMNNTSTILYTYEWRDNKRVRVKDPIATAQAATKQTEIDEAFSSWVRRQENQFAQEMEQIYNEVFNSTVGKQVDVSSFESFPGATKIKIPREHQKAGVMLSLERANLLAHEVGTGKTITLISSAMEMRRLGIAKKPVIVVQRSTFDQFVNEIKELYPMAKVLVPSSKDLSKAERENLFAKIAYNDWDIVVLYHSYLDSIPDDPDRVIQYMDELIQEKLDLLDEIEANNPDNAKRMMGGIKKEIENLEKRKSIKQEEKTKAKAETRAKKLLDRRTDNVATFEQLGIDALLIDEAHAYKKLGFATSLQGVKGIDTAASQRAQSLRLKTSYILENNGGKNVVFATGTPISNTMAEMWTFIRYLLPKTELQRLQMNNFDSFVNNFGTIEESSEFSTSGKFRITNRFSSYSNIPELLSVWDQVAHTVLTEEVSTLREGVGTPRLESGQPIDVMLEQTRPLKAVMKGIKQRLQEFEEMTGKEKKENSFIPLVMFGLAKRAAIDVRLVDPNLPDDPASKLNRAVSEILEDLEATKEYRGAVAVFCDSYQSSDKVFNLFDEIKQKLIDNGIPAEQIANINDYKTDDKKGKLFEKVNDGDIRVVMGSTEKLGVGVNIQERLHMLVHMDAPVRPSDYQQRNGRIARQGNKHLDMDKTIKILRIGVKQTLDVTGYQRLEIKKKFIDQVMKGDRSQRTIEEEEMEGSDSNNFSQMMASLSGSQAALAFALEQNKLRKLRNAEEYHHQNQVFIAGEIKSNENLIRTTGNRIQEIEKEKEDVRKLFPDGKVVSVKIGNKTAEGNEEIDNLLSSTINKRIEKEVETLRKAIDRDSIVMKSAIEVNGKKFDLFVRIDRRYDPEKKTTRVTRSIDYEFAEYPKMNGNAGARVENMLREINSVISLREFDETIQRRKIGVERAMNNNEMYKPQLGKPFAKKQQLEETERKVEELEAQMKAELAEIEAKDAAEDVEAIEIREEQDDEGNGEVRLKQNPFSRFDESESMFPDGAMKAKTLRGFFNTLLRNSNNAGPIHVVETVDQVPAQFREKAKEGRTFGFYDPKTGETYFVTDNIQNVDEAFKTWVHEVGAHKGLRNVIPADQFTPLMEKLYDDLGEAEIRAMIPKNYWTASKAVQAEEYLAYLSEKITSKKDLTEKQQSIWQRLVDRVRDILNNLFNPGRKFTREDAENIVRAAVQSIYRGPNNNGPKGGKNEDEDIRFRKKEESEPMFPDDYLGQSGTVYREKAKQRRSINDVMNGIRQSIQDRDLPIRDLIDTIKDRGGKIKDGSDAYKKKSLSYGRMEYLYKEFSRNKMKPVIDAVAAIIKDGMPAENMLPYMIAKHAVERNGKMRNDELNEWIEANTDEKENGPGQNEIDAKEKELAKKDYSGVSELDPNNDFENPDDLARAIVKEMESKVSKELIDNLWSATKEASTQILDYWVAGNSISPKQYEDMKKQYKYFIPLRGWREGAAKQLAYTKGEGFAKSLKHAEGRKTLADNPLAHLERTAFKALGEQVDNEVKQSAFRMVMDNYADKFHDLYELKKVYYVKVVDAQGNEEWEPTISKPPAEMFESGSAKTKIYREYQKRRTPRDASEHEVLVQMPQGDVVLIFKGPNLSVAQSLNNQNRMYYNLLHGGKLMDATDFNNSLSWLSPWTNMLKAMYTSWNVVFPLFNFTRDAAESSVTAFIKGDGGAEVIKQYRNSFPAILRYMRGKNGNGEYDVLFREFMAHGGQTGFTHLRTVEELEKDINKELNRVLGSDTLKGKAGVSARKLIEVIQLWNQVFEDATRFSVYLSSLKKGKSADDAAYDAKEGSVNFNRKGKMSKGFDAYFAFFNPAIQGAQKNFSLAKRFPKRFAQVSGAFMGLGMLEAILNNMLPGDDDEDYQNISEYVRQNYMVIPDLISLVTTGEKSDKYLRVPLPQFWRGFHSMGNILYDVATGNMDAGDATKKAMVNFVAGLSPVDIAGLVNEDGEFSGSPLWPTIVKPIVEVIENKNFMGYQIAKEPFTQAQKDILADSGLGKNNVNPAIKFFTDMLFRLGGGDNATKFYMKDGEKKKVPNFLDWNPSHIEHILKGYTGGTGGFVSDLMTTAFQAFDPEEPIDFKNAPFVNAFIRKTPEAKWRVIGEYYDLKDELEGYKPLQREYYNQTVESGSSQTEEAEKYKETAGNEYYREYESVLNLYDGMIGKLSEQVNYQTGEGSDKVVDMMNRAIDRIEKVKLKYDKQ